jgi:hypothetical protein
MQPSKETITQTVIDVMSQRQFQFEKPEFKLPFIDFFGFEIFILITVCGLLFLLYKFRHKFSRKTENKPSSQVLTEAMEFPLQDVPIEKLHAMFLKSLQSKKMVMVRKWKTNADYIDESGLPLFQQVCSLYDATVYGMKAVSQESVSLLRDRFATWENEP